MKFQFFRVILSDLKSISGPLEKWIVQENIHTLRNLSRYVGKNRARVRHTRPVTVLSCSIIYLWDRRRRVPSHLSRVHEKGTGKRESKVSQKKKRMKKKKEENKKRPPTKGIQVYIYIYRVHGGNNVSVCAGRV